MSLGWLESSGDGMVASFFLVMIESMGDLDDVSVVELVLEGDDFPHEAQSTKLEEGVSGLDQD